MSKRHAITAVSSGPMSESIRRLYLGGLSPHDISKQVGCSVVQAQQIGRKILTEANGLSVAAFKGLLAVKLCGILDRHTSASAVLVSESESVLAAIRSLDDILLGLGLSAGLCRLVLQVPVDSGGAPVWSSSIGAEVYSMLPAGVDAGRVFTLSKARAALVLQAESLGQQVQQADRSLADALGKVGVAAIRGGGGESGPIPPSAHKKLPKFRDAGGLTEGDSRFGLGEVTRRVAEHAVVEEELEASRRRMAEHLAEVASGVSRETEEEGNGEGV